MDIQANSKFITRENNKKGKGLCIAVGSGMLMATMDLIPECYRFVEYKDLVDKEDMRKLYYYGLCSSVIVVNAWFSISKPEKMVGILSLFDERKIVYYSNQNLIGKKCNTLNELKYYAAKINFEKTMVL